MKEEIAHICTHVHVHTHACTDTHTTHTHTHTHRPAVGDNEECKGATLSELVCNVDHVECVARLHSHGWVPQVHTHHLTGVESAWGEGGWRDDLN